MKNIPKITPDDLKLGDVIMCHGDDWLANLIQSLDEYLYTHAAIYVGNGEIANAMMGGIEQIKFERLQEEVYVDIYRFNKNGHRFGDRGWSVQPVIDTAEKFVSEKLKYAWDHLILGCFLVLTRRIPLSPIEKKWFRIILDHGAEILFKILDHGKTPMTCTEFVYLCFSEAKPEEKYMLEISGLDSPRMAEILSPTPSKELRWTSVNIDPDEERAFEKAKENFLVGWKKMRELHSTTRLPSRFWDPVVAACIWPKDLATSPDLRFIGRIRFKDEKEHPESVFLRSKGKRFFWNR